MRNFTVITVHLIFCVKSRRMGGVRHVERMGEKRNEYKILFERLKGRGYCGDVCVDNY